MPAHIEIISAGAGTGKTHRITNVIRDAVAGETRPDAVIATTFTKKAASELLERARSHLLNANMVEAASLLAESSIGTVHSVCGQILRDYAFEAGLSPALTVLPNADSPLVFDAAIGPVIESFAPHIQPLATRLSQLGDGYPGRILTDWRAIVRQIADAARNNLIDRDGLRLSAERSCASIRQLLQNPILDKTSDVFNGELVAAIRQFLANPPGNAGKRLKGTQAHIEKLEELLAEVDRSGHVRYSHWATCAKLKPPKTDDAAFKPLRDLGLLHPRHPGLYPDLAAFIELCFACAADAMDAYAAAKRRDGLIDFIDQECEAYRLLRREDVCRALSERFDLLVVDEFQDTSPIELAVFMRLAACVRRAVWVGDQKQTIYGFHGADPDLMDAVIREASHRGGDILEESRRSRPDLVRFTNWLFTPVFGGMDIPPKRVRLRAHRTDQPGHGPAIHFWRLPDAKNDERATAIAAGIVELLQRDPPVQVQDPLTSQMRPVRPGDVLLLARDNRFCGLLATALAAKGVRVAIERAGLLEQPECRFAMAAVRYLVDPDDTLAVAEMLNATDPTNDGTWLREWIGRAVPTWRTDPRIQRLDGERGRLLELTPGETLDVAITASDAVGVLLSWGAPAQRLANLDALRELARKYEDHCRSRRSAATAAGFIAYLADTASENPELNRQPRAAGDDAVSVMTYHRAKGLEAPVAILTQLENAAQPRLWEPHVLPRDGDFDPEAPLDGRWIRLWPWPYGMYSKDVDLDARAQASPEYADLERRTRREETRLLYVGVTRARDILIFAGVPGETPWLNQLVGEDGQPLLTFPTAGARELASDTGPLAIETRDVFDVGGRRDEVARQIFAAASSGPAPVFRPARLVPSATTHRDRHVTHELIELGPRLPLNGHPDMERLGNALHDYFAAEARLESDKNRCAFAARLMARWEVASALQATDFLEAGRRLTTFILAHYPASSVMREYPVHRREDGQDMYGQIDMLVASADRVAIIDHKTFPGSTERAIERAVRHFGQLNLYARAVHAASGRGPGDMLVHMPILGVLIRLIAPIVDEVRP